MISFDLEIGARTVYMEARGEPEDAQKAVARVLVNRVRSSRWGDNLVSVCLWPYQFSSWNTNDSNRKAMSFLKDTDPLLLKFITYLLDAEQSTSDPTSGATHYYALYITEPLWVKGATFCGQFGKQKFYKDVR